MREIGEMARRMDLVATVGPASFGLAGELVAAGATSLRINSSHLQRGELRPCLETMRKQAGSVPVVVDLQGAKMRLGRFDARRIREGEVVEMGLLAGESAGALLPLPHPEIFQATRPGRTLSVDDGRLRFEVERNTGETIRARALLDGELRPRKGVNVVEHPVELSDLSPDDQAFVQEAEGLPSVSFAFSFIRDGREAEWIRRRVPDARVVAKIERVEAAQALDDMVRLVDEIWVCRGDLGEQMGMGELARFVGELEPRALVLPVLMAGQVLEHLTHHDSPTRSEVCHLHDIVARGYAGIVLSDETAIGNDPVSAVRQARRLVDDLASR